MLNLTIALDEIVGSLRPPPYPTYAAPLGAAFFLLGDLPTLQPRTRNAAPRTRNAAPRTRNAASRTRNAASRTRKPRRARSNAAPGGGCRRKEEYD